MTFLLKSGAPTLYKIGKRMFKEVLLTLIMFNCFNIAYSAGIHFTYNTPDQPLHQAGTVAAVLSLMIIMAMVIGLALADEDGFGEFK